MPLNFETADRQAIGASFARPKDVKALRDLVMAGTLRLPPQPDWKGNVTDWKANPLSDRNWQFQHHTLRWINPLRWAALEGDEPARAEWLRIAESWCAENIPAERAEGTFAWKDMADGNRAIQLSLGARLIPVADLGWYIEGLRYHRDWLMDSENIVRKNHGMHQHAGLLVVSALLRDEEGVATAYERMARQFETTFDEQGGNDEGATKYHLLNMQWWTQTWERVAREGLPVPEWVETRKAAAATALAHLCLPDGQIPQIGDSVRGRIPRGVSDELDYVASSGQTGTPPKDDVLILERGYVASRSGWGKRRPFAEESHMLIRHGENLRAHEHQDRGSVHVYAKGRGWLVDSGFYSYQTNDPIRRHLASREAHNLAILDGLKHDDGAPVDLVRHEVTDDYHDFELSDRGYESSSVTRRVTYFTGPDCWIVWDTAETAAPTTLTQRWHLDLGVTARREDRGFTLLDQKRSMNLAWFGRLPRLRRHSATAGDLSGWLGTAWKTLKPSTLLTAQTPKHHTHRLVTLIAPSAPTEIGVVRSYLDTANSLTAHLIRGPRVWSLQMSPTSVTIKEINRAWA